MDDLAKAYEMRMGTADNGIEAWRDTDDVYHANVTVGGTRRCVLRTSDVKTVRLWVTKWWVVNLGHLKLVEAELELRNV